MTTKSDANSADNPLECSVCLQTCIYPVQLPCRHIFCFLCVKGAANRSKRCALCRKEIPMDYFNHPRLVKISKELQQSNENESSEREEKYSWYYEGRNGWWQYDERTNEELETAYSKEQESVEILIAGFLYVIDFENMVQMRRNDPTRQRIIKRDLICAPKKGVAGLKMQKTAKPDQKRSSCDGEDKKSNTAPQVRKTQAVDIKEDSASEDPVYASSLQFTNTNENEQPEYLTISNPANELSSHTFHPVSNDSPPRSYINSTPEWDRASSGYASMTSTRSSRTDSLSSENVGALQYENHRAENYGSSVQGNIVSVDTETTNTNLPPTRKISRNAKKRSGRTFTKEEVELPTPSLYDTVGNVAHHTYLNDRRTEPLPTPMVPPLNLDGKMSDLSISENPRRLSARQLARNCPPLPELIPPPLPRRTNSLTSSSSQKNQQDDESHGLPGRAVRQNQRKDSKPNITHL
ncbi:uncharacterized protein [Antedon mediterranea]|uniref:uncharacterized protein n=1 Tax=Antedon mediterranea TaxID=105859 RepID=UPI003AF7ECD3